MALNTVSADSTGNHALYASEDFQSVKETPSIISSLSLHIKSDEYNILSDYIDTVNSAEVLKYLKNPIFADILKLTPIDAVKRRNTIGGTSPEQVKKALKYYKNSLIAK